MWGVGGLLGLTGGELLSLTVVAGWPVGGLFELLLLSLGLDFHSSKINLIMLF